jgi:60 kDa SS-A/Ro ribonucleoprotein
MSRVKALLKEKPIIPIPTTANEEKFPAYERPLEEMYLQTLFTNTVSNIYYANEDRLLNDTGRIHTAMLKKDPEFASIALGLARQKGYMRLQPVYGLAMLSQVNTNLFAKSFPEVILIPSDLQDFLMILNSMGRGEGGRAIKRVVSNWLNYKFSGPNGEYWALKYNGSGRGYSLGDIIKLMHPKNPVGSKNFTLFGYLIGKEGISIEGLPQIQSFENLKRANSDVEKLKHILEGRLPHEVVTGACGKMTPDMWAALVKDMPVFATLRNLNTLDRAGVLDGNRKIIEERFTNPEILAKSKILPFQFLKAFDMVSKPWVKDALRLSLERTFDNLPEIPGRTAIFFDKSGSMQGDYIKIGAIFGYALYKKTGGNAIFWTFDTSVYDAKPSMHDTILSQAERIRAGGSTSVDAPMRALRQKKEKVDNIILITDEQQNTGKPFYQELAQYRRDINPNVRCFIIDLAPYNGHMVPPTDNKTFYIFGWSDQVLKYISQSIEGYGNMVGAVMKQCHE